MLLITFKFFCCSSFARGRLRIGFERAEIDVSTFRGIMRETALQAQGVVGLVFFFYLTTFKYDYTGV